jgi:hypothetical protein
MQSPSEKAPGLDGCIDAFYKQCWGMIKGDVVGVIQELFSLRANCWNLLNSDKNCPGRKKGWPSDMHSIDTTGPSTLSTE